MRRCKRSSLRQTPLHMFLQIDPPNTIPSHRAPGKGSAMTLYDGSKESVALEIYSSLS